MASWFNRRKVRPAYPSAARQWSGILFTALVAGAIELVSKQVRPIEPGNLLLLTAILVTFWSGLRAGLISVAISFVYFGIHYSEPGTLFVFSHKIVIGLLWAAFIFLLLIVPIGLIQNRLRNAGIREWDARLAAEAEAEQRHRTEASLRSVEDKWRLVFDSSMDAIIMMEQDGTISLWNRSAETKFGWSSDEVLGKDLGETIVPPVYRDAHRAGMRRFLESGEGSVFGKRLELTGLAKDGREFPIELSIVPHWTDKGATFIGFVRDMTEQTKLNERLRQAHKMEAIGTLAAGIAHDFNNILASISGNLLIAQQDIPVGHPARESHAQIEKAVARAANVVRQILSFSSPSAVKTESIDLEATLNDAVSLLRTAIPSTVEFDTELALNLPSVYADATDIHQILLNLCINAHQAMPGGRGKIAISAEKVYLNEAQAESLVTVTPGWYARIGVKDDGAGMDPTTLKRIFDPFFTTKGPGEGTGLGLAVIYGIVERHRGAITVYSEVGKGSVFSIYLPTAEAISATDDEPKPKPMLQGNGERILYVDDDESLVYMMTRLLPRLNYEVVGFDDPRKGLEAFRADPSSFDLVITDMSMPYLDGPALVHELKAIRQDIPLVMVTGYIRDGDLEKTQSMGVNALMLKPNTVQEMSEDLHRILSGLKEPVTLNGGALNP